MTDAAYLAAKALQLSLKYDSLHLGNAIENAKEIEQALIKASFRIRNQIIEWDKKHG